MVDKHDEAKAKIFKQGSFATEARKIQTHIPAKGLFFGAAFFKKKKLLLHFSLS